ncbi:MAG: DsbA family oxidoreductase [Euzebya sp.]
MLTLFHDVTDPASAVAVARYGRLAADGLPIMFEGFEAVGVDADLPVDLAMLAGLADVWEVARDEGVVLHRPPRKPPTGLAHVLLAYAEATPQAMALRRELYQAYWAVGSDIGQPDVLTDIAVRAGLPGVEVRSMLADRTALATRRRQMSRHRKQGVGGVPVVLASRTLIPALIDEAQIRELALAV